MVVWTYSKLADQLIAMLCSTGYLED